MEGVVKVDWIFISSDRRYICLDERTIFHFPFHSASLSGSSCKCSTSLVDFYSHVCNGVLVISCVQLFELFIFFRNG